MKIHKFLIATVLVSSFVLASCELVTEDPPVPILKPANHLVINEVFTLPITHQRTYSWIEFYNPTDTTINTNGWTFSFTSSALKTVFAFDSNGTVLFTSLRTYQLSDSVYEIPLPRHRLASGQFLTATNNDARLTTYTDYGQGNGPIEKGGSSLTYRVDTIRTPLTTVPDTVVSYTVIFHFRTTDQLVLKNPSGQVVDVVRYGNYTYPGPGADPYPGNRSVGAVPDFQSVARYYGAYSTGISADDFYITWPNSESVPAGAVPYTKPIPHWLSQAYKK